MGLFKRKSIDTLESKDYNKTIQNYQKNIMTHNKNIDQANTQEQKPKQSKKLQKLNITNTLHTLSHSLKNKINTISHFLESLIFKEPLVYSLSYENNIACKLNGEILVTKDKNLCAGIKLEGISYAGASMNNELDLAEIRNKFFNKLDSNIELNIFIRKELIDLNLEQNPLKNIYANEIINKWEKDKTAYKISYYLLFSTKTKRITGFLEEYKRKKTQEKQEESDLSYESKIAKIKEVIQNAISDLSDFLPKKMSSDDILNFYATYSNMQETNLKYSFDLISDCYITSDVEFKKDYMIFHRNDSKKIWARFLSVKAYETEGITSLINTEILKESVQYYIMIHAQPIPKNEAIKKIKRIKTFSIEMVQEALENLVQLLQSDRENILKISYSILILSDKNIENLNDKTNALKSLLERHSLSVIKETLNQKPLFFSFFPSRGNLNARLRHQTSGILSALLTFENDIIGNKNNRWGDIPVTILPHISGSPFFFNFHDNNSSSAVGHTLVIGGTGYGKTTIMQFLMMNLFKYDINIFAMDKMRGMHNFTEYMGGEYHDLENNQFKLNPFSLANTEENNTFLLDWLAHMGQIKEEQQKLIEIMYTTLKQLRLSQEHHGRVITLLDFFQSLTLPEEEDGDLNSRFRIFLDSLFNHEEDALDFKNQLSILNMDSILKNQKLCALCAYYIFHKIKNISKNQNKGFFIWIDELRDYLNDENMRDRIIEMIVEIRKINGVITMGIQNLDFLDGVKNAETFIDNMTNFIIFPTKEDKTLNQLQKKLSLTDSEINFLRSANKNSRQILLKQKEVGSAILNVNLEKLGKHLRVFSSSSKDVLELKELKIKSNNWRELYLQNIDPQSLQKDTL